MDNYDFDGVAPPGWENTVKKMKRQKDVSNPWALAWWMKKRGAKPHVPRKKAVGAEAGEFDDDPDFAAELDACLHDAQAHGIPIVFQQAASGNHYAIGQCLDLYPKPTIYRS